MEDHCLKNFLATLGAESHIIMINDIYYYDLKSVDNNTLEIFYFLFKARYHTHIYIFSCMYV